ncbi:39S ribosomal protein L16, mitochondrial [Heterodontus francisci]|uniref:39S ribosomal protein L16, mitochondrial n=1 Tax=Heterodontus francisci TaxID=7792 RepID=UPI00355B0018
MALLRRFILVRPGVNSSSGSTGPYQNYTKVLTVGLKTYEYPPRYDGDCKALGGGYLHWGHFEMMRLTINRHMDAKTMFARWRVNAPYKPITRKGLGQRMGGGKGAIDHYVTPVKYGRIVLELGGKCTFEEVEPFLCEVAKKLPFPAKAVSKKSLEELMKEDEQKAENNQNPWTFERIATMNMMGIRKVLSPFDLKYHGKFCGKSRVPNRV